MPLNWLSGAAFKEGLKNPASLVNAALRKAFVADEIKEVDVTARTLSFTISTASPDRDKDTIDPGGWQLASFQKNPVVMWAHDYDQLPIARAISIVNEGVRLTSIAQFATRDLSPFADSVYQMLKAGFLNATSVGFRPLTYELNADRGGVDFKSQELFEYSVVPIPANPDALISARSVGIDLSPFKQWAERVLDSQEPGLWLPKAQVAHVFKLLETKAFFSVSQTKDDTTCTVCGSTEHLAAACPKAKDEHVTPDPTDPPLGANDEPLLLSIDEPPAEMRLFLDMEDEPVDLGIDSATFQTAFRDTIAAALRDVLPGVVAHETDLAIRRARGQAV